MKVLFQNIGVLVQYNWALPFYMLKENTHLKVVAACSLFSYSMGGFYYHLKVADRMSLLFSGLGISRLDHAVEAISVPFIRSRDFDVLHLNSGQSLLAKKLLCERTAKMFTFHGSIDDSILRCKKDRNQRELGDIYSKVDAFVAVSNYSAKTIREVCGFDPLVVHNGVDTSVFNPSLPKTDARKKLGLPLNKKIILWNGRISPEKRLEVLIRAIPRIIKEDENVLFLIKGRTANSEYSRLIKCLIKKLGVGKHIKWSFGWMPNIHLATYYRASDAYVHTSISEGFSLTLLEAMASGMAVIGNDASSIPEAIGDSGLLYNNSSEDLAENVLNLLCNDDLVRKLGERAFKCIMEKFTWSSAAKKYLQIYNEIF